MYYISINPFANRIPKRWPARRKRAQHNSKLKEWESKVPSLCSTQIIQQHPVDMHSTFWKSSMKQYQKQRFEWCEKSTRHFFLHNRIRWAIAPEPRQAFRLTCFWWRDGKGNYQNHSEKLGFSVDFPTITSGHAKNWYTFSKQKSHKMSDKKLCFSPKTYHMFWSKNFAHKLITNIQHIKSFVAFKFGEILGTKCRKCTCFPGWTTDRQLIA